MDMEQETVNIEAVIRRFAIYGEFEEAKPFGSGHINSTYQSVWNQAGVRLRYTHQRINEKVFARPDEVMENISRVTDHIREKSAGEKDASRRTLTLVPTREGMLWARDSAGGWWRTYLFVEGSRTLEQTATPEEARFLGESIARFQSQLSDLGEPRLHETIPGFHDMEKRYRRFYQALAQDSMNRAGGVKAEIEFMKENEERGAVLIRALKKGTIPERICHNDTKINNILIDDNSGEGLCVIDLDTVMPGTSLFDSGDLIRTVANRSAEDEKDCSKVMFDPAFFEALLDGYLKEARNFLTSEETELLCESGRNLTQIMALRFLTDYLEGDQYYRIARPEHNLDRCRAQIAFVRSMDAQWAAAEGMVKKLLAAAPR